MIESERYRAPRPMYFEGLQGPQEVLHEYDRLAEAVAYNHDQRITAVSDAHVQAFAGELGQPGTAPIEGVLFKTQTALRDAIASSVKSVEDLTHAAAEVLPNMLSVDDRLVLRKAKADISSFGITSAYVRQTISQASTRQARDAIRAALDTEVLRRLRSDVGNFKVGHRYVEETLNFASTPAIRAAMRTWLDDEVLKQVCRDVSDFRVLHRYVRDAVDHGSSQAVKKAIRSYLDEEVYAQLKSDLKNFSPSHKYVQDALDHASHPAVKKVFSRKVDEAKAEYERRHGARHQNSNPYEQAGPYTRHEEVNPEDILFNFFSRYGREQRGSQRTGSRSSSYTNAGPRPPYPGAQERASQPQQPLSVDQIIQLAILNDKTCSWLTREDRTAVQRVIDTVRSARAKAAQKGEELTDREIYMRYRRSIDKPEFHGQRTADPRLVKSFQILQALMGGKISGKLPF